MKITISDWSTGALSGGQRHLMLGLRPRPSAILSSGSRTTDLVLDLRATLVTPTELRPMVWQPSVALL